MSAAIPGGAWKSEHFLKFWEAHWSLSIQIEIYFQRLIQKETNETNLKFLAVLLLEKMAFYHAEPPTAQKPMNSTNAKTFIGAF